MADLWNVENLFDISGVPDGTTVHLCPKKIYHVYEDDCPIATGYYASNTAMRSENPDGRRPTAIWLEGKKDVVIEGHGATIIVHGIMTPFVMRDCERVSLRNLTVDYARPTMNEFAVAAREPDGTCMLKIHPDSLFDLSESGIVWHGETRRDGLGYYWTLPYRGGMTLSMYRDPDTEYVRMLHNEEGVRFPCVPEFARVERIDAHTVRATLKNRDAFLPVGTVIQTRNTVREQLGGIFERCKELLLENLIMHFMHGFGLLAQFCENVVCRGVRCVPSNGRTIACNADIMQFSGCRGQVLIENCAFQGAHDDCINIHGTHLKIVDVPTTDTKTEDVCRLRVRFMNPCSWGFTAFFPGDCVEFINKDTLLPYGAGIVLSAECVDDTDVYLSLALEHGQTEAIRPRTGDCVANDTCQPTVVIRNNAFGPSEGRGILCISGKPVRIEGNTFYRLGGNALCLEDDCNFWFESGYTTSVVFRGNTMTDTAYGPFGEPMPIISVNPQVMDKSTGIYVHGDLIVEKNIMRNSPGERYAFDVRHTRKLVLHNNQAGATPELVCRAVGTLESQYAGDVTE